MISNISDFINEVIDNDNRAYQYRVVVTPVVGQSFTISNEYLSEAGGVVIDEAVSSDGSLDIGTCVINKLTLVLQNYDGHWDDYDFRGAGVVLHIGLMVNGSLEEFTRGMYIVKDMPQYDPGTVTLTCYDYMVLLEKLVKDVSDLWELTTPITIGNLVSTILYNCGNLNMVSTNLPLSATSVMVPKDDTMTCRDLLHYVAQMNGMNCQFNENGYLTFRWYGSGYTDYTIRQLEGGAIRIVEDNVVRISYPLSGEVIWTSRVNIPVLYSLIADRYDTVVTGVRIVLNAGEVDDDHLDAETYLTGSDEYMVSIEQNPLITTDNASSALACLAASLVGFRYRQATFSHPGMPWIVAGDSASIVDFKGQGYTVLISSTVFTSLERQTSVSSGAALTLNAPSRFTPETKAYVRAMEEIKPVVNTINQRIANANGLYETDEEQPDHSIIRYLHNKSSLAASDIQIVISDVGVLMTANGTAATPTWYGLTVDGTLLASILSVSGINADWINTGALVIRDSNNNIIFKADQTNRTFWWNMARTQLTQTGVLKLVDDEDEDDPTFQINSSQNAGSNLRYSNMGSKWLTIYQHANHGLSTEETNSLILSPTRFRMKHSQYGVDTDIMDVSYAYNSSGMKLNNKTLEQWITDTMKSTPTFTPANGITVSQQTWSKVGNIVTGDITFRCSSGIGSTTTTIGQLNEKPGHSVIGNARTSSVVARCSIDSSGNIKVNSSTSINSTTDIMLTLTFVAS